MRRLTSALLKGLLLLTMAALIAIALDRDPLGMFQGRLTARSEIFEERLPDISDPRDHALAYFAFGDFSALSSETLNVSAAPWVLTTSLLALRETDGDPTRVDQALVKRAFQRFGFIFPTMIGNWPGDEQPPALDRPLGQNVGFAARHLPPIAATIGNFGCAICHAGVMYDEGGQPAITDAWLGSPNTSINLEAYTDALFDAMSRFAEDEASLWAAIDRLHPDLSWRERWTLRWIILPVLREKVDERQDSIGRLLPFRASLAGATNGLDTLKQRLGLLPDDVVQDVSVFNSIPELGGRVFRAALLNTSSYAVPEKQPSRPMARADITEDHLADLGKIVAFFTVPSMGVSPEVAAGHIDDTTAIMHWLADYRPQPFPAPIDPTLAKKGTTLYRQHCASCHGEYEDTGEGPRLRQFPNWLGDIGTDGLRASLFDERLVEAVERTTFGRHIDVRLADGYAAPPLDGIWSSAPYFHNGSVPTLWHLMNPEERPEIFQVGGHAIDLEHVGIEGEEARGQSWAYPEGYAPWSEPVTIDTSAPGLSHEGHEEPFTGLTGDEKWALIEFLKRL